MSKSKRMKNNASSVQSEQEMIPVNLKNKSERKIEHKDLISKHGGSRKSQLQSSKFSNEIGSNESKFQDGDNEIGKDQTVQNNQQRDPKTMKIGSQFTFNLDIIKIMARHNFPSRFPLKMEQDDAEAHVLLEETGDQLVPIETKDSKINKSYIKFWNKIITKQTASTRSISDHQITEKESGYFPFQMKMLFSSPETYLKKSFCQKSKYRGPGHQLLSSPNQFVKVSKRSLLKIEVNAIFTYYSNPANQYFIIPIELTSKLSRSMVKSMEIGQMTQGCNKIAFTCDPQNMVDQTTHPLFTIKFKDSIDEEVLPTVSLNLVDNYFKNNKSTETVSSSLSQALFNYPFLSHFLYRKDFSIDSFFARCWHYSRFFCQKLDLGIRANNMVSISIKDAIFKYLLSCSARICIAIKYWVLNPEESTYFRCRCGQKVYDEKQESKLLKKFSVGTVQLFNHQQKIQEQDFHLKHIENKNNIHICGCNQHFKDHVSWFNHALSTKISDISKICPIVLYNISKISQEENRFVCDCSTSFYDYDFWSFWIHICGCKILRNSIKNSCHCSEKQKSHRSVSQKSRNTKKRKRSASSRGVSGNYRKIMKLLKEKDLPNSEDENSSGFMNSIVSKNKDVGQTVEKVERNKTNDNDWQSGDSINLPLKMSGHHDTNQSTSSKQKSSKRRSIDG